MEINDYDEILGVVPTADVVEGRFGVLSLNTSDNDFGSDTDLPGFTIPATAELSKQARYVITWPVDNRPFPAILSYPSVQFSMRQGFDRSTNLPATVTLYATNPAAQESMTIPSGYKSLAFRGGTVTIPSGGYIYNAALRVPGALVTVANTAVDTTDAGKLKYSSTFDADTCIGKVLHFNATTAALTVILDA